MPRYIDAEQFRGKHEVAEVNGKLSSVILYADIVYAPTADVVPKSEVEELKADLEVWKQNRFNIFQMLELYKMTEQEVAREIFAEIERKVKASIVVHLEEINKEHIQDTPLYDRHSGIVFALRGMEDFIAELKKKYTEGETDESAG